MNGQLAMLRFEIFLQILGLAKWYAAYFGMRKDPLVSSSMSITMYRYCVVRDPAGAVAALFEHAS